jgi:hypothetical protein
LTGQIVDALREGFAAHFGEPKTVHLVAQPADPTIVP